MTVHVTHRDQSGQAAIKIDGWLQSADLAQLVRALVEITGVATVDLSGLEAIDDAGLAALSGFVAGGARLVGAPAHLTMRMRPSTQTSTRVRPGSVTSQIDEA